MKAIFFCITCILAVSAFSQAPAAVKTKDYYLSKSKQQRTISWLMLSGGVALTTVGIVVTKTTVIDEALGSSHKNNAGPFLAVVGAASVIGSIPFFISASQNRHKALALTFDVQKLQMLYTSKNYGNQFQPALTLKVSL